MYPSCNHICYHTRKARPYGWLETSVMVVWLNRLKTTIAEVKDHPQGESIGKQGCVPYEGDLCRSVVLMSRMCRDIKPDKYSASSPFSTLRQYFSNLSVRSKIKDILSQVYVRWILSVDVSQSLIVLHYKQDQTTTDYEKDVSCIRLVITFAIIQEKRDLTDGWKPP